MYPPDGSGESFFVGAAALELRRAGAERVAVGDGGEATRFAFAFAVTFAFDVAFAFAVDLDFGFAVARELDVAGTFAGVD